MNVVYDHCMTLKWLWMVLVAIFGIYVSYCALRLFYRTLVGLLVVCLLRPFRFCLDCLVNWLLFFRKIERAVVGHITPNIGFVMESVRSGSTQLPLTPPDFQADVGYFEGSTWIPVGQCVRFANDVVVSADHVLADHPGREKFIKGRQGAISIQDRNIIQLAADLSAIKLSPTDVSTIGVKAATIGFVPDRGIMCQIVGSDRLGTAAVLHNDPKIFGRLVYAGTTVKGYSGSAYYDGKKLLGIHNMGGAINGGWSASYAWMKIKQEFGLVEEDSEEFLENEYAVGKKIRFNDFGSLDEIEVYVDGRYHIMQKKSLAAAFGDDWYDTDESGYVTKKSKKRRDYNDYESKDIPSVSGEAKVSKTSGALSSSEECPEQPKPNAQSFIAEFKKLSNSQQAKVKNYIVTSKQQNQTTAGPASQA